MSHGLVPINLEQLLGSTHALDVNLHRYALTRLASIYAALGLYDRAIRLDRRLLTIDRSHPSARRRLVWSLLRTGHFDEAANLAKELGQGPQSHRLSHRIADTARRAASQERDDVAGAIARLPVFTRREAASLLTGWVPPEVRTERH